MDRRVRKTKQAIREAFLDLILINDNLSDITITSLCALADINRKTFYNNYRDINDLIDQIENEIVFDFTRVLTIESIDFFLNNPDDLFQTLVKTIDNQFSFYQRLMSMQETNGLINKIKKELTVMVKKLMLESNRFAIDTVDFVSIYMISGILGLYQQLFEKSISIPKENLPMLLKRIVMNGIASFVNE